MEELLPYYEREIGIFRAYSRKFAQRYPKTAGQLLIAGEHSEDPHIERLIQSFALLTARVSKRLDSDYPQFTESMLESLYPHYLRPLPSYSVVQMTSASRKMGTRRLSCRAGSCCNRQPSTVSPAGSQPSTTSTWGL
jgi:type VI secretion system protein ImpG